jgi:hypothetical protein
MPLDGLVLLHLGKLCASSLDIWRKLDGGQEQKNDMRPPVLTLRMKQFGRITGSCLAEKLARSGAGEMADQYGPGRLFYGNCQWRLNASGIHLVSQMEQEIF